MHWAWRLGIEEFSTAEQSTFIAKLPSFSHVFLPSMVVYEDYVGPESWYVVIGRGHSEQL